MDFKRSGIGSVIKLDGFFVGSMLWKIGLGICFFVINFNF